MSNLHKSGAVLFAKDPQRLARFYEALADLEVTYAGDDIIVLESEGHQLLLHPIPARIARGLRITSPPTPRTEAVVKLVFAVNSIAEARARAASFGGELDPPERMFEARGFRACDGCDPEGNIIQFREEASAASDAVGRRSARKGSVDYATVRKLALAFPDVVDSSTLRGISFKARGRLLACTAINRSAEPETLMVRIGTDARDRLIAEDPQTYYLTPHYLANASVLVRLHSIDRKALQSLLGMAWQFVTAEAKSAKSKAPRRKKAGSVFRYL